jgi:membrane protein implicated in regulation of membrane protease activity
MMMFTLLSLVLAFLAWRVFTRQERRARARARQEFADPLVFEI